MHSDLETWDFRDDPEKFWFTGHENNKRSEGFIQHMENSGRNSDSHGR